MEILRNELGFEYMFFHLNRNNFGCNEYENILFRNDQHKIQQFMKSHSKTLTIQELRFKNDSKYTFKRSNRFRLDNFKITKTTKSKARKVNVNTLSMSFMYE